MTDLISRQEAIDALADYIGNLIRAYNNKLSHADCVDAAKSVLDDVPAAEPEIVRCENCKRNYGSKHNPMCDFMSAHLWPDSFCSYGEGKDDE